MLGVIGLGGYWPDAQVSYAQSQPFGS